MQYLQQQSSRSGYVRDVLEGLMKRAGVAISALCLLTISVMIAGCGSGGGGSGEGVSPQVVSGVAATGAPLTGQVTLKDFSSAPREKTTVIGSDGSFAIDVSDMKSPFILKATGTVDGERRTMFSFAEKQGTANINPLTSAALASAAGVDDPAQVFDKPDSAMRDKIKSGLPGSVAALQSKLKPLLAAFDVAGADPIKDKFAADHSGLDDVFDNVNVTISNGTLTITNATTGAVIFTARVKEIENGQFTDKDDDLPKHGPRPAAPTGVKAAGGAGQVTISWDAVPNATSYNLYWSTKSEGKDEEVDDGNKIKNVTSPFIQTGLAANTTYFYVVRAINGSRKGPASVQVSATTNATTTPPTIPAAPAGVIATGGTKQATISWPAVSGAASYNLYWSTTTGVTTANGTKISGVTSPTVQTGLADATTYFYILTAVNSAGESTASVQVAATTLTSTPPATAPAAPTGVSATGGANQVTLSWPAVSGAASYNLYWSTTSGVTVSTGTRISGVTSPFVHIGLTAGTAYFYVVTAVNSVGESAASGQATATTNAAAPSVPAAPTGVTAAGGAKQVTVSWSAVSGATSYNLYWSTASGVTTATGTKVTGATSPHVQPALADGTAYFFIVTAVNSAGESAASSQATATTIAVAAINGATLYLAAGSCVGCHAGGLDPADNTHIIGSAYQGASAALITSGIANVSSMRTRFNATNGTVFMLTPEQIVAISAALR